MTSTQKQYTAICYSVETHSIWETKTGTVKEELGHFAISPQGPLCSDTFFGLSWEYTESLEGEHCSVTDFARICAGQPEALRCCQESSFCQDLICM